MLISIALTLVSPRGGTLPAEQGRANYAELLNRLETVLLPGAAAQIHDINGLKPLACSGLLGSRAGENETIHPGATYCVRVSSLTGAVTDALVEALLRRPPRQWRLGTVTFNVTQVACDPAVNAWGGRTTYEALADRTFRRHNSRPDMRQTIALEFISPTSFSSPNDMQVPVPMPGLVFGSLAERWNAFSPIQLDAEARRVAEETLAISNYRLTSRVVRHKNGALRIGGVGEVTYTALTSDLHWLAVFQMLGDFAFYSGVGVQTASGMGQVRRIR